jgi:hypothetical protein
MPAELTEQPVRPSGSLYQITSELVALMAARDSLVEGFLDSPLLESEKAELLAAMDAQIKAHIAGEVRKVDGIRAYLRNCEAQLQAAKNEILRVTQYQRVWESRHERVKDVTLAVLREFVQPDSQGRVKLEGATGSLAIHANGGKLALEITQPELVPDEFCRMVGWIQADAWDHIVNELRDSELVRASKFERTPANDLIRAALESDCETCAGLGRIAVHTEEDLEPSLCGACGGDGKTKVPGARFLPRGERLVVK